MIFPFLPVPEEVALFLQEALPSPQLSVRPQGFPGMPPVVPSSCDVSPFLGLPSFCFQIGIVIVSTFICYRLSLL